MARNRRAPEPQEPQGANAFVQEGIVPGYADVQATENAPGQPAQVRLNLYYGPLGPNLFMFCRTATLPPADAIQLGEILVREGTRVKSGVEIPAVGAVPADLREAIREGR